MNIEPLGVNAALVRERRLELGMSERSLTAKLGAGFSQTIVRAIEAGKNQGHLTLDEVARLAAVLDLPITRLLATDTADNPTPRPAGPTTQTEHLDRAVKRISAALLEVGRGVAGQALAELAGIDLTELTDVLDQLDARLRPAGLCVHQVHGDSLIRAVDGTLNRDEVREVWRRHLARRGLNIGQAKLVHRAARGEAAKLRGNDELARGGALVVAGILVRTAAGGYVLSPDTAFSLMHQTAAG